MTKSTRSRFQLNKRSEVSFYWKIITDLGGLLHLDQNNFFSVAASPKSESTWWSENQAIKAVETAQIQNPRWKLKIVKIKY